MSASPRQGFDIRILEQNQEAEFLDFLGQVPLGAPGAVHYDWIYHNNPHGRPLVWVAVDRSDGRIVGSTSAFPRRMRVRGEEVLASVGGDTFVDPRTRGQGVATAIHEFSLNDMPKRGIAWLYGCPNPPNLRAMHRAGGSIVGEMTRLQLPLRGSAIFERTKLPSWSSRLLSLPLDAVLRTHARYRIGRSAAAELAEIPRFDSRFDSLTEELASAFGIFTERDSETLNWRFFDKPTQSMEVHVLEEGGRVEGFAALEFNPDRCFVFDLACRNEPQVLDTMISGIVRAALDRGSPLVTFETTSKGPYVERFLQFGFRTGSEHPVIVMVASDSPYHESVRDADSWYLTLGDQDIETRRAAGAGEPA